MTTIVEANPLSNVKATDNPTFCEHFEFGTAAVDTSLTHQSLLSGSLISILIESLECFHTVKLRSHRCISETLISIANAHGTYKLTELDCE